MDIEQQELPTWHYAGTMPDRLKDDARHKSTNDPKEVTCWACIALLEARKRQLGKTVFGSVTEAM